MKRRGLSQVVIAVLLLMLGIAAVTMLWATFNGVFSGSVGQAQITSDDSNISVNSADGSGTLLIVIWNHGPAAASIYNITIIDDAKNRVTITPTGTNAATIACKDAAGAVCRAGQQRGWDQSVPTGLVVSGSSVGYSASRKVLIIPSGQRASFQFLFPQTGPDLRPSFTPNSNYQTTLWMFDAPLKQLQVQATSE